VAHGIGHGEEGQGKTRNAEEPRQGLGWAFGRKRMAHGGNGDVVLQRWRSPQFGCALVTDALMP
jgi:hypothetical protein